MPSASTPRPRGPPSATSARRSAQPDDPAGAVEALNARLGLDRRWSDVGVSAEDLDLVAELAPGNRNVVNNPRPVSEDDARAILAANE